MKKNLESLLGTLNSEFDGALFQQDTGLYANKLLKNAELFCHYSNNKIVGCIAFYANDKINQSAFISLIGIDKNYRKMGLGKILLQSSIAYLKKMDFKTYGLEVISENKNAIDFYLRHGFQVEENRGNRLYMIKKL